MAERGAAPGPLRVLHVCASDDPRSGAARAALRLHGALRRRGVESRVLAGARHGDDPYVLGPGSRAGRGLASLRGGLDHRIARALGLARGASFSANALLPGMALPRGALAWAGVVQLHWLGGGALRPGRIPRLGRPVVWRMPDMFPFTGGCHYSGACRGYETGCGACPMLGGRLQRDLSRWNARRKRLAYARTPSLTMVAPSRWLAERARRSRALEGIRVEHIATGVDLDRFRPLPREAARAALALPESLASRERRPPRLIGFGTASAENDPRKGFARLCGALERVARAACSPPFELVTFGPPSHEAAAPASFPIRRLGRLRDDPSVALAYGALDCFAQPSLEDNLPNTTLEALACGVPVVGFATGGLLEAIDHGENGFLARPGDDAELAAGLAWALADEDRLRRLSRSAREKAERCFDLGAQAGRYAALYGELRDATACGR